MSAMTNGCDPVAPVLVMCPSHRDHRELAILAETSCHRLIFHDYATIELEEMVAPASKYIAIGEIHEEVECIVAKAASAGVVAVVSTDDYPGSTLAAIVAQRLGLPGTPVVADLFCQHKYQSRLIQQLAQPDAVPPFALVQPGIAPDMLFPFFIKPVKSFFSVGAYQVDNAEALRTLAPHATLPDEFFEPLNALLKHYAGIPPGQSNVLAEGLLTGSQATFEGYAFEGQVHPVGVVDSIMFPGTLVFERFEYPSALSQAIQDEMAGVAARVMKAIGFTHGQFNIEFCYDSVHKRLSIVEINPRMASQFSDLYEKVDGFNSYSVLLDLALGRRPTLRRRVGPHAAAASCVFRRFEDMLVVKGPSRHELESISLVHADVRIEVLVRAGERLSEQLQDGRSFRYGIVSVGGRSREEVLANFDWCRQRMTFTFEQSELPAAVSAPL